MTWWEEDDVSPDLNQLRARLEARGLSLRVRTCVGGTEAFPVRATTSLNVTGPPWDEDVVLSADVKAAGDELVFESDVADREAQVLAEGPGARTASTVGESALTDWANDCLERYLAFVSESLPLVERVLERAGTSNVTGRRDAADIQAER